MELNINSPAYYTNIYGIDDEIYWMCKELSQYTKNKEYSKIINTVGIVPVIAPKEELKNGLWKEIKRVDVKYGFASVSLHMDYEKYINANVELKKSMMVDNILKSIKTIKGKAKIDYEKFENDVRIFCIESYIVF